MDKDETLKLALEALEDIFGKNKVDVTVINVIKEALAQPEQEPVAFVGPWHGPILTLIPRYSYQPFKHEQPLYTAPPHRTWVGLTEEDKVLIKHDANFNQFMTAGEYADRVQQLTEARLKDKNT